MSQEVRPDTPPPPRFDDEIDLVDLALALWRRKWLILFMTVLGGLLGLAVALQQNPKDEVTAVIMLGKNDAGELVETPATAANWLETGILPAVTRRLTQKTDFSPESLNLKVQTGQGAAITVESTPPTNAVPVAVEVIEQASAQLAQTADKPIRNTRIRLQSEIEQLEIELDRIQDSALLKQQRTSLKQQIQHNENLLASANDTEVRLEGQIDRFRKLIALQQDRAEEINAYLKELRGERPAALKVSSANEAMTAMLLNNQVQQYANRLSNITQEITVELPQKIGKTQDQLAEVQRKQQQLQTDIEQATLKLETFEKNHLREVAALKTKINNKQATLGNMQTTALLNPPQHHVVEPKSQQLLVALGIILGGFFGLFSALLAGFISSARERLYHG
ncbi:Wzz/FepE/Etk N-terminal domain-containing protein [Guyparkeria sp. 1SP6A2]|nr:Wzz/FepE/Etk N-terminal domain-containing protein [Guyparkeria sp. 1SP6A2]